MSEVMEIAKQIFNYQNFIIIITWIFYIFILIMSLGGIWFLIWYLTYRIKVYIYEPLGNFGLRKVGSDKAKLIKRKDGVAKLRFFWRRRAEQPIDAKYYLPTKRGKEIHYLFDGTQFHPLQLNQNPGFENINMNEVLWLAQTQKEAIEDYSKKGFWDKYGTVIMTLFTVLLCIGALAATIWFVNNTAKEAINVYGNAIKETGRSFISKPPGA